MSRKQQADDGFLRPALRPVAAAKLPPGRKILPWGWWEKPFDAGTVLLWREQVAERRAHLRAIGKMRHSPDRQLHKQRRRHLVHEWINHVNCPDCAPEFDVRYVRSCAIH